LRIDRGSTLEEVVGAVAEALERADVRAILTGGACATFYTKGEYQSEDLDFVLQSRISQTELDEVMGSAGFHRRGDHYVHPKTRFFVEFPRGPLGIGRDLDVKPIRLGLGAVSKVRGLSATDSCRDRLAAYYHWQDRQSLEAAVRIARRNQVNMKRIRAWSIGEGALAPFREFQDELARARRTRA
jgi:hypothetical protein